MNKKMTLTASAILLLLSPISQAAESTAVKTQDKQQTQTRNMSTEKNTGQGAHLQNMESMTEQERNLYQQLNSEKNKTDNKNSYGKGKGQGKGKGNGGGSGKKKRQRQNEGGDSDYNYFSTPGGMMR